MDTLFSVALLALAGLALYLLLSLLTGPGLPLAATLVAAVSLRPEPRPAAVELSDEALLRALILG